jgi:hypothetical protein
LRVVHVLANGSRPVQTDANDMGSKSCLATHKVRAIQRHPSSTGLPGARRSFTWHQQEFQQFLGTQRV